MPLATAKCRCMLCGENYTEQDRVRDRTEVKNYEEWRSVHHDICYSCYQKIKRRQLALRDEQIYMAFSELPEIHGASERQADYARSLRLSFLQKDFPLCLWVDTMMQADPDHLMSVMKGERPSPFETEYSLSEIQCAYVVMRSGQAKILIQLIQAATYC